MINATKKWLFLKISSIVLVPLVLWFLLNLVSLYDKNYDELVIFFTTQPSKFLFSILVISMFFYSSLSISEVFEDYITNKKLKNVANRLLYLFAIIIPLFTFFVLYKLTL
jgi:succinate dehydrogenase / fumarate reductase membrane anchor subunit|tara:strand:- start:2332 stop:2661 length:330 start_codon:yes stop_codon:yes gene_type:complete